MAEKKKEKEVLEEKVFASTEHKKESIYDLEELAQCSQQVFHVSRECLISAFLEAKKECATLPEAKEIIQKFLKKEVK